MKNKIRKLSIISSFVFLVLVLCSGIVNANQDRSVGTKYVTKTQTSDYNIITKTWGNIVPLTRIEVPSSAYFTSCGNDYLVSYGWNYERWHQTNYYESDLGYH